MDGRITALEDAMNKSSAGVVALEGAITQLKVQLNDKDQELYSNDVDIAGIPERGGENIMNIIKVLSMKLGIATDERDIVRAERIGSALRNRVSVNDVTTGVGGDSAQQRPRNIIVRFARQITRDEWLRAARVRRLFKLVLHESYHLLFFYHMLKLQLLLLSLHFVELLVYGKAA
ncbi:unnamed protein product [Diatraea saccharalis]|uniref:Uncharacterized protein n=1 Tax=Diatraea saccharalis TaxID=40085 RepID=A0A9N9WGW8_9NEOP|nr:unnamed protein product [Diatraea saccharalis]